MFRPVYCTIQNRFLMRTLLLSVSVTDMLARITTQRTVLCCASLPTYVATRLGEGAIAVLSLSRVTEFVPLVAERGWGGQDGISCVEPFQKQAGCSHFGRSGQDPYKTWLQGAVLGSSIWDNCLPRGRHCRTSKFTCVWKCVVCTSSLLSAPCVCVLQPTLSPHLAFIPSSPF